MKVARIQHSLKDLNKDIGNCERQLSRVLKVKESQPETARSRSQSVAARNSNPKQGYRQPNVPVLTGSVSKPSFDNQNAGRSRSPRRSTSGHGRNIICKEVIGDKYAPTRVEVVVRTQSSKKRSRSAQAIRPENEIPTRDISSKNSHSLRPNEKLSMNGAQGRKSTSWGHILLQQNSSASNTNWNGQGREKVCTALHYSSMEDDNSSTDVEKWVQNIPREKSRSSHLSSKQSLVNGNARNSDAGDNCSSSFNPLRTLNFLIKELRGKVHKDHDENMQRIIEDMEKALCCIPLDHYQTSTLLHPSLNASASHPQFRDSQARFMSTSADGHGIEHTSSKNRNKTPSQEKVDRTSSSAVLVNRLMSTVSRITKMSSLAEDNKGSVQSSEKTKQREVNVSSTSSGLQAQLEQGCKQLEETCHQMEETCENLRLQKNQLVEELKQKSRQLENAMGKNQQLTLYAADIRQEMCQIQQGAELAEQEHKKMKEKLVSQQRELQESNNRLNQRLEETIQENERLTTELQLSHLEKDKLHILLSNKDLEVAKLKKEIVDINTLVTEQLTTLRSFSGKKSSLDKLSKMMGAVFKLHGTVNDSTDSMFMPTLKDGFKNHVGDGEGSRSRPICSSPTSSVNSSLYSSWQLMSDITATDQNLQEVNEKVKFERKPADLPVDTMPKRDKDSGINTDTPVDKLFEGRLTSDPMRATSKSSDGADSRKGEKSADELKAGLRDMFEVLKKQTSEVVNVTFPSPPRGFDLPVPEKLGVSQWTELSASESTVLFHSSDESDSDDLS